MAITCVDIAGHLSTGPRTKLVETGFAALYISVSGPCMRYIVPNMGMQAPRVRSYHWLYRTLFARGAMHPYFAHATSRTRVVALLAARGVGITGSSGNHRADRIPPHQVVHYNHATFHRSETLVRKRLATEQHFFAQQVHHIAKKITIFAKSMQQMLWQQNKD